MDTGYHGVWGYEENGDIISVLSMMSKFFIVIRLPEAI